MWVLVNGHRISRAKENRGESAMLLAHLIYLVIFKLKWINDQLSLLGRIMALPSRVDLYVYIRTHIVYVFVCSEPYSFLLPPSLSPFLSWSFVLSFFSFIVFESNRFVALPDFQTCQMNFVYAQSHSYTCTWISEFLLIIPWTKLRCVEMNWKDTHPNLVYTLQLNVWF